MTLISPFFGLLLFAAVLTAGALLKPARLLTGLIALIPVMAWLDTQRYRHLPASVLIITALLSAVLFRRGWKNALQLPADPRGARGWWWAFGLYALGGALALFWLMPFSGNGAAFSALVKFLPGLYSADANQFEFGLSAALQLLCIPAAAAAAAALFSGMETSDLSRSLRRGFQGSLLVGCGFVAAGLAGQGGGALMKGYRFNPGLPDPNSAGTFYLIACAALIATWRVSTAKNPADRRDRFIARGWLALGVLLVLATGSRVALFALPLVVVFHLLQQGVAPLKILRFIPLAALAGYGLLYLGYRLDQRLLIPFVHPGAVTHLYQVLTPDYIASQGLAFRGAYWRAALLGWLDAPLGGIGIGRLYGAMGQYMSGCRWPVQYFHENAHNQWLQWLSEMGMIGFFLAGVAQLLSWGLAGPAVRLLLLALMLTAITGHPLLVPVMPLLLGLLLGLPEARAGVPADTPFQRASQRWLRFLPLAALFLGMITARPHFPFTGHVRGDGSPMPEKQARWTMSCPLWNAIHQGVADPPFLLSDSAARRGAIIMLAASPAHPVPNGIFTIPVRLNNLSSQTWPADRDCSGHVEYVHLAYHWQPLAGSQATAIEGDRTLLPADLPPGQSLELELTVRTPPNPEDYILVPDALQEEVAWFTLPVTEK